MSQKRKIKDFLNDAIQDLKQAKKFVDKKKFENAEDEIAHSLKDLGNALKKINKKES